MPTGTTGTPLNDRLGTFAYSYDVKSNITGIAESGNVTAAGPRTRSYALDIIERLTRVADGPDAANDNALESYMLDEEGNRVTSDRSWPFAMAPGLRR
ncbi:MAG: hypothetical protein AAGF29_08300 [Pseudomonadota bacterium]